MRRHAIAYADARLTIIVLLVLVLALVVFSCLTPRQEWRHQNEDVLPAIRQQIDEAYLTDRIDKARYDELLRLGNLYREAVESWGRCLIADGDPAVKQAEALRLLAKIKAELAKELEHE